MDTAPQSSVPSCGRANPSVAENKLHGVLSVRFDGSLSDLLSESVFGFDRANPFLARQFAATTGTDDALLGFALLQSPISPLNS